MITGLGSNINIHIAMYDLMCSQCAVYIDTGNLEYSIFYLKKKNWKPRRWRPLFLRGNLQRQLTPDFCFFRFLLVPLKVCCRWDFYKHYVIDHKLQYKIGRFSICSTKWIRTKIAFWMSNAPAITPNTTDITVLPGQNYSFSCESTEPVTWKFEKVSSNLLQSSV